MSSLKYLGNTYDENNVKALILKGRVYTEVFKEYSTAIDYFETALAIEVDNLDVQEYYVKTLLWNHETDRARKFIDYALEVKGADKGNLYTYKVLTLEKDESYDEALKVLEYMPLYGYNSEYIEYCEALKIRIENKIKMKGNLEPKKEKEEVKKETVKSKLFGFLF